MPNDDPARQHRGDRGAYERYLRGMDASMRQKVALTAAHLRGQGRVADMGMGSGTGSEALAQLYPGLDVVGVDLDPTVVAMARERFRLPNLSFVAGDIAASVFAPESLDGILDSSVLHHVTSFGGYDHDAAARCLEVQVGELREHGVLVVRDFVEPEPCEVLLDVPADDGDASDDPARCSTAALLERFAREFRSLSSQPGFPCARVEATPSLPLRPGFCRYRISHKHAAELVLRKDYRTDWVAVVKEEYTYFTAGRFERIFDGLGLRVLASTPLRNPWIVRHRLRDKLALWDLEGRPLEAPSTNYVIVGEKVPANEGVRFVEAGRAAPLGFLEPTCWRDRRDASVRDLVRRPNLTLDVLPWFRLDGDVFVLVRASYPRPILAADDGGGAAIDGSRAPGYVTEPLVVVQGEKPLGQTVEEALATDAGIEPSQLRGFRGGTTYYPSPGGVQEEVRSALVEIEPLFVSAKLPARSGFSTSGRVRAIESRQLLRAAQVGGLPDARLELNVYELLRRLELEPGPWIGEEILLAESPAPPRVAHLDELARRPARRVFERVSTDASPGFLELRSAEFDELDRDGNRLGRLALERVVPRRLGLCTMVVAPLRRHGGMVFVGIDDDDLPAAQCFNGNSELLVAPAWRLPRAIRTTTPARAWVLERLRAEYGAVPGDVWELGGRYHPSPGVTPEVVHPIAVEVLSESAAPRALSWLPLTEAASRAPELRDGHLRIAVLRAWHALRHA